MSYQNRIRRLPPGAPLPNEEPAIYTTSDGYRVWRWKVGLRSYVEVLEHRIDNGRVTTADHIHHKNRDTLDNRVTNLEPLGHSEHARHHHQPKIDYNKAWRKYEDGYSTIEVGREFGVNPATLSRRFRSMGYELRGIGEGQKAVTRRGINKDQVVELHMAGMRAGRIATQLGTTVEVVRSWM